MSVIAQPEHRGFQEQALHYLVRPHERVLREPLEVAAAWRGDALGSEDWCLQFGSEQLAELEEAPDVPLLPEASASMLCGGRTSRCRASRELLPSGGASSRKGAASFCCAAYRSDVGGRSCRLSYIGGSAFISASLALRIPKVIFSAMSLTPAKRPTGLTSAVTSHPVT